MSERLMVLPASDFENIRLVSVPDDVADRDALRHVTALIAELQEECPECSWEDIVPVLEDHGFIPVDAMLGPELS